MAIAPTLRGDRHVPLHDASQGLDRAASQSSDRAALQRSPSAGNLSGIRRSKSVTSVAAIASLSRIARQTAEDINSRQTAPLPAELDDGGDYDQDTHSELGSMVLVRRFVGL